MGLWDKPLSKAERAEKELKLAEYSRPANPATYASDIRPLSDEDRDWIIGVQGVIWKETSPDRFGYKRPVEADRVCLSEEELGRVFRLIREHRLVTSMGSGTFGFGYSIAVFEDPSPTPGVEERPSLLLCLTEHHLPHPDGLTGWPAGTRNEQKEMAWQLFSQFTHSPENAKLLEWHKMDLPEGREYYDY